MITSNVKKIMEDKEVTIRKMVEVTGLSDTTILRARCGQINLCRLNTLEVIAGFLECSVKDLFDEENMLKERDLSHRTKSPEPKVVANRSK